MLVSLLRLQSFRIYAAIPSELFGIAAAAPSIVMLAGDAMSDEGKSAAIAELRREVGFGCPVCRSPFLTWHLFDPPDSHDNSGNDTKATALLKRGPLK